MNDAMDVRESDARAFELVLAVQALKHAEKFVGMLRVETSAIVANEKSRFRHFRQVHARFRF